MLDDMCVIWIHKFFNCELCEVFMVGYNSEEYFFLVFIFSQRNNFTVSFLLFHMDDGKKSPKECIKLALSCSTE